MKFPLLSLLVLLFTHTALAQPPNSVTHPLDFLKTYNGKLAHTVGLLEKPAFKRRLERLVGQKHYLFMQRNWQIDPPMEFANGVFVAEACQRHSCGFTDFMVIYDFNQNKLFAGIRRNRVVKTYAEKGGTLPARLEKWTDDPYKKKV